MRYEKIADPFYLSPEWRAVRRAVLERDGYLCRDCLQLLREGKPLPRGGPRATVVHHEKERKLYPELALDMDNLSSLCDWHHEKRHPDRARKEPNKPTACTPKGVHVVDLSEE